MKQLAAADIPEKERRRLLRRIVDDETMRKILADPQCQYRSRSRRLLFLAMRLGLHPVVYGFVKLQVSRGNR